MLCDELTKIIYQQYQNQPQYLFISEHLLRYAFTFVYMNKKQLIVRILKKGGIRLIYSALLLYYAFKRKDLPAWARSIVIGVIGYLISPFDSIPDITPIVGYTDDLGILSYALVLIAAYVNDEVRTKAKNRLLRLLGNRIVDSEIKAVEKII